jgi:hypothetical protein
MVAATLLGGRGGGKNLRGRETKERFDFFFSRLKNADFLITLPR